MRLQSLGSCIQRSVGLLSTVNMVSKWVSSFQILSFVGSQGFIQGPDGLGPPPPSLYPCISGFHSLLTSFTASAPGHYHLLQETSEPTSSQMFTYWPGECKTMPGNTWLKFPVVCTEDLLREVSPQQPKRVSLWLVPLTGRKVCFSLQFSRYIYIQWARELRVLGKEKKEQSVGLGEGPRWTVRLGQGQAHSPHELVLLIEDEKVCGECCEPILPKPKVNWFYLESKFHPGLSALELEVGQGTVAVASLPSVSPVWKPSLACGAYTRDP